MGHMNAGRMTLAEWESEREQTPVRGAAPAAVETCSASVTRPAVGVIRKRLKAGVFAEGLLGKTKRIPLCVDPWGGTDEGRGLSERSSNVGADVSGAGTR